MQRCWDAWSPGNKENKTAVSAAAHMAQRTKTTGAPYSRPHCWQRQQRKIEQQLSFCSCRKLTPCPLHTQITEDKIKHRKYICSKDSDVAHKMLIDTSQQLEDHCALLSTVQLKVGAVAGKTCGERVWPLLSKWKQQQWRYCIIPQSPGRTKKLLPCAASQQLASGRTEIKHSSSKGVENQERQIWFVKCSFSGCNSDTSPKQPPRSLERTPVLYF